MEKDLNEVSWFLPFGCKWSYLNEYDSRCFDNPRMKTNWRESIKFCSVEISGNYYIKRTHDIDLSVETDI